MIILGPAGAGKTILILRLVTIIVKERQDGAPVPVVLPIASWDQNELTLREWIVKRLCIDYGWLAEPLITPSGTTNRAQALLDRLLLFPIFDGFDEIAEGSRDSAIRSINSSFGPDQGYVLSSRANEFHDAVNASVRLLGAAGISINPVDKDDAAKYLRRATGSSQRSDQWDAVIAELGTSSPVGLALQSPLMISIAKTVYMSAGQIPGPADPAELCDRALFLNEERIKQYLFEEYVAAAYRSDPFQRSQTRLSPPKAMRWLRFLARHVSTGRSQVDLEWWDLHAAVSPGRIASAASSLWLLVSIHVITLSELIALPLGGRGSIGPLIAIGFVGAFTVYWTALLDDRLLPSQNVRVKSLKTVMLAGISTGALAFALMAFISIVLFPPRLAMIISALEAAACGLAAGLAAGLTTNSADLNRVSSPSSCLRRDRRTFATLALVVGCTATAASGLLIALFAGIRSRELNRSYRQVQPGVIDLDEHSKTHLYYAGEFLSGSIAAAILLGSAIGLCIAMRRSAWPRYAIARALLAATGTLPFRLERFLNDAHHHRAILRQVGASYQFRHIEMQRRLAILINASQRGVGRHIR